MNEFLSSASAKAGAPVGGSWVARLIANYCEDHRHPVNHVLHVGVGWPLAAIAVIILPFHPLWSLILFVSAYAFMFSGHFIFERNVPTVFKHPTTPFVIAASVARGLFGWLTRHATAHRAS
jgi:hypothetical protein